MRNQSFIKPKRLYIYIYIYIYIYNIYIYNRYRCTKKSKDHSEATHLLVGTYIYNIHIYIYNIYYTYITFLLDPLKAESPQEIK